MTETSRKDYGITAFASTRPGGAGLNEDACVVNDLASVYGVIDGVSAMGKSVLESNTTSGYIASRILAEALQAEKLDPDLRETVMRANAELRERMDAAGVEIASKWKLWSAVFAIFRVHSRTIEFVQSGDCMLFARYRDGSVRVLTYNRVAEFDLATLNLKHRLMEENVLSPEEVGEKVRQQSMLNRGQANRPDGYSVMNGDPELAWAMEYGSISRSGIRRLYAVTDGMFHFIENSSDPLKWERFLDRLDELGIERYIEQLVEEENLDPDCRLYPRHKKSDDKSAVIVDL